MSFLRLTLVCCFVLGTVSCGDDADDVGIASECENTDDCDNEELKCLTDFKGGYCGISGCTKNADCPDLSVCVAHDDGTNYCFRTCTEKSQCNENRSSDNEANCSSSITLVDSGDSKACVPPSN